MQILERNARTDRGSVMAKTTLQRVQEYLVELDNISLQRQEMFDKAWILEKRTMDIRQRIHKLINGHEHL